MRRGNIEIEKERRGEKRRLEENSNSTLFVPFSFLHVSFYTLPNSIWEKKYRTKLLEMLWRWGLLGPIGSTWAWPVVLLISYLDLLRVEIEVMDVGTIANEVSPLSDHPTRLGILHIYFGKIQALSRSCRLLLPVLFSTLMLRHYLSIFNPPSPRLHLQDFSTHHKGSTLDTIHYPLTYLLSIYIYLLYFFRCNRIAIAWTQTRILAP